MTGIAKMVEDFIAYYHHSKIHISKNLTKESDRAIIEHGFGIFNILMRGMKTAIKEWRWSNGNFVYQIEIEHEK